MMTRDQVLHNKVVLLRLIHELKNRPEGFSIEELSERYTERLNADGIVNTKFSYSMDMQAYLDFLIAYKILSVDRNRFVGIDFSWSVTEFCEQISSL